MNTELEIPKEKKRFTVYFGGGIASLLLVLYTITVGVMIWTVVNIDQTGSPTPHVFPTGVVYIVTMIGGLISALVISKLTVTKPGENPAIANFAGDETGQQGKWINRVAIGYLFVWLGVGLSALVFGVMLYPDVNQTLSDIGTTWLGLAVASAYAYFGIDPSGD